MEVRKVNKKVLGIAVTLLLAAMFIAPAMAKPATKIEGVTATVLPTTTEGVLREVDHGILQIRGGIMTGPVTLSIPGQAPLVGTYYGELNGWIKLDHPAPGPWLEAENLFSGKVELSFPGGTFVGIRHFKMIGFPTPFISHVDTQMVLHGTGDFKGQTLKLSYEGALPPVFEGYLIMPK
jgi:hypothetical protein